MGWVWLALVLVVAVLAAYIAVMVKAGAERTWSKRDEDLYATQALGERLAAHLAAQTGIPRSRFTVTAIAPPLCRHPWHMAGRAWARARARFLRWVARVEASHRGG